MTSLTIASIILSIVFSIFGIATAIIGYFLRRTMDDLKETQKLSAKTKSELDVLSNDHTNKYNNFTDKLDDLKEVIQDLTKEIKNLNSKA